MKRNELLIKIPTRSRPEKFQQILNEYKRLLSGKHKVLFLISIDHDDATMNNPSMLAWLNAQADLIYRLGNSKSKIEAVNADINEIVNWSDALLVTSDDMIPKSAGYDEIILTRLKRFFGPNMDGVLHFNDGRQGANLNTLPIMGTTYYNRFGYVYNPEYISLYADNEFTDVSRKLGKSVYFADVLVEHGWMNFIGKDALFERNENPELYAKDRATYEKRKAAGFPVVKA